MTPEEGVQFPEISHPKKRAFLVAYSELGNRTQAAKAAGIDRRNHSNWMRGDGEYRTAFEEAHQQACETLEEEARRRAVDGVEEPVHYKGEKVDTVKKYSDTLLMFLLKGALPEKYRERYEGQVSGEIIHEHSGKVSVDAVIHQVLNEPDYLEYQRQRALQADSDPGPVRQNGEPGKVEDEAPPGTDRPGPNGSHPNGQ